MSDITETFARRHAEAIGPFEVVYEPRNSPEPWMVSVASERPAEEELRPHVHARTLAIGIKQLDRLLAAM